MSQDVPSWKKKHFELLCRIDEICRQCDIPMFLCDDTALKAYKDNELSDYVSIAIDTSDAFKFLDAINIQDGLFVRGMHNYECYPTFDLKVYNPETIDFNIRNIRQLGFCGIYVTVEFIQHIPDISIVAKGYKIEKAVYRGQIRVNLLHGGAKNIFRKIANKIIGIVGNKTNIGKRFFNHLVKRYSSKSIKITIGRKSFDSHICDNKTMTRINGKEFFILGIGSEYIELRYGANWMDREARIYRENAFRFRDGDHTWEDYEPFIDYLSFDDYFANQRKLTEFEQQYKTWNDQFVYYKRILRRTHLRYIFWQKYMPMKEKLMALYADKSFEMLNELLEPYTNELRRFAKYQMTIFFDRDIFDIARAMFDYEDERDLSIEIERLIPKEHLEPIQLKDYKGEII